MEIEFSKNFKKSLKKLLVNLVDRVAAVHKEVAKASNLQSVRNIKKLKGYSESYRIRIGDYRLLLRAYDAKIIFHDIGHRKDIYKDL